MAVELVMGTFEQRVGQRFAATPAFTGNPLELVLASCDESPYARADHESFSLVFDSNDGEPREQQIFRLLHEELGELDSFLVPIGARENGIAYEAVINN